MKQRKFASFRTLGQLFLFLGFVGASFTAYATTNHSYPGTVLKLYRPFGDVVDQALPVVQGTVRGQCDTQSHLILREDAWRCQAKGVVYDPCFVKPSGTKKEALCPRSPWQGDSVLIAVPAPLNNKHHQRLDMSLAYPWAVELVNGVRCQAVDTHQLYDSMPVRYQCHNQHFLFGYLQRCKSLWSMLKKAPKAVETAEFKRAWF